MVTSPKQQPRQLTQEEFKKFWENPSNVGSFAGARYAKADLDRRGYRTSQAKVLRLLKNIPTYAQYARLRRLGVATRHVRYDFGVGHVFQADLFYMPDFGDYKYGLVLVDVFDSYIYARPLKTKSAADTRAALVDIIAKNSLHEMCCVGTDAGTEFTAQRKFLLSKKIRLHVFAGRHKAFVAERSIQRVKERLYPALRNTFSDDWVALLDPVVFALNNTPNRGMSELVPADVNSPLFDETIRKAREDSRLKAVKKWAPLPKKEFEVGQLVFVEPDLSNKFRRGYHFSRGQLYRVSSKDTTDRPYTYKLVDVLGKRRKGVFYARQLEKGPDKIEDMVYPVEKILATRKDPDTGREKVKVRQADAAATAVASAAATAAATYFYVVGGGRQTTDRLRELLTQTVFSFRYATYTTVHPTTSGNFATN